MNDEGWQERTDTWVKAQEEQRIKKEKQRENERNIKRTKERNRKF